MGLSEYQRKRRFDSTPEPSGASNASAVGSPLRFVIQKHEASRLHYDFRLELGGVLKSWAVPKGPSPNPADKRLAMMVEDHPLEYRDFEGTIPEGNYGAGTVMVWDEGTWEEEPQSPGLDKGELKFILHGHKLAGSWVLVKTHGHEENSWLLIKHKDEHASETDVTHQDRSVLSGRTMGEIAEGPGQWLDVPQLDLSDAPKADQPAVLDPMLATLADEPTNDPDWLYEIKWDGYRIMAHLRDGRVQLLTRNHQDYTSRYQPVADELADLRLDCILDGEMVVIDEHGRSTFSALQNYQQTGVGNLVYYVFDLPFAGGHDLRDLPLTRRKELLAQLVAPLKHTRLSDHVVGEGKRFFQLAQDQQLEGIMAKAASSPYRAGKRSHDWLKIKTHLRQEAVIGGYTEPRGGRKNLGALVLGLYDTHGQLHYIGHCGGGFTDQTLSEVLERLKPLERSSSPFVESFPTNTPVQWVEPQLLAEISFAEWTADGHLRQPIFQGLRDDKPAKSAVREVPSSSVAQGGSPDTAGSLNVEGNTEEKGSSQPAMGSELTATASRVKLTHLDKLFWPADHLTKGDLIAYYDHIADTILPYLKDRPESLNRHPNGIEGGSFFQKDVEKHPDWVKTVPLYSESNHKDIHWLVADDRDTLLYMANLGCIELNPWHSRFTDPDRPDYCLLDLDAKTIGFDAIITVAQEAHRLLGELNVTACVKTSGKTGLHICIPLGAKYTYEQSKQFAQILMNLIHDRLPDITSVERNPDKREHKVYLDFLQNRAGQTMAAPYCVRPVPGATVSTPLAWDEVNLQLNPKAFTIRTMPDRLHQVGDLWQPVLGPGIDLDTTLDHMSDFH
ncbi:MAG TPA: DNA ligase D [Candidatus Saccharimonadia bacterium]|jgi:bifunctional non-homologous end joining protein LigD